MKSIYVGFIGLLVAAFFAVSCAKQQHKSTMATESEAVKLAKAAFAKTGRKVEDYRVTVETDSTGGKWIVWFDVKGSVKSIDKLVADGEALAHGA
jgi:hypothetical protein